MFSERIDRLTSSLIMRLNFSHATPEQLERGMAVLAEVILERRGTVGAANAAGVVAI